MRQELCRSVVAQWLRKRLCTVASGHTLQNSKNDKRQGTVYVHWPFCSQLCIPTAISINMAFVDHEGMTDCLKTELHSLLSKSNISRITSVYFGGGTPSLARPSTIEAVLNEVESSVELCSNAEVTLEVNPTSAETNTIRSFRTAGINRLSLGVQSLDDEVLQLFNRDHTVADAQRALEAAEEMFPGRTNTDIIFGRPSQTYTSWLTELQKVLGVVGNHLSLYQLTVEQGTPLSKAVKMGTMALPESDTAADMYEGAVKIFEEAGLKRYEVSNFARPGFESRHNLSYWTGRDYIGIGPGAHSRFANGSGSFIHSVNTLEPNAWMKKVKDQGDGRQKVQQLSKFERFEEVMVTCLRTTNGLTNKIWSEFMPSSDQLNLQHTFSPQRHPNLLPLFDAGLLILDESGLRVSSGGLSVLDSILPECIEPITAIREKLSSNEIL